MPYTREEYIAKFGYDPELDKPIDPNSDEGKPGVVRNLISTATSEIGSLPTLAASIPQEIIAASKGAYTAYTEDKNFLEEYNKERMNDNAQQNIDDHLKTVAQTWAQQEPDVSEEDLQKSLQNYIKSKEFEDFTSSQLKGAMWFHNRTKDAIRGIQGDDRTQEEIPMWENIAGIAATAGIGAPATIPMKIAGAAARVGGATNVLVNNPLSRGAIKTAELLTPVTIPYTPVNAALNFGVGVGIDQAQRYAQGHATIITAPDDSGVKAMAATGIGIAGVLATVAAVRGRTTSLLNAVKSDTARALENIPSMDRSVADPMRPGEASIVAGPEQQLNPKSYNETLPWYKRLARTGAYHGIDQNAMLYATVRDVQGPDVANTMESQMSQLTGSIARDRRINQTMEMTQPINDVLSAMPEHEARAGSFGLQMSSYAAELDVIRQHNVDRIDALTKQLKAAKSPQGKAAAKSALEKLKDDLRRFDADEESARPRLPDRRMADVRQIAEAFNSDQSPRMMQLKAAVKKLNRDVLDEQVSVGKLSKSEADKMHERNPYFVQTISDPLKGETGANRAWRSVNQAADRKITEASSGTAGAMVRESPIEALDRNIPKVKDDINAPETRVTAQLEARSSIRQYVEHHILDINHTRARNEGIRQLGFKDGISTLANNETDFQKNGHMRVVKVDGNEWIPAVREKDGDISKILEKPNTTREWQNGYFKIWEFGDVSIVSALRAEPALFNGLVRAISKPTNLYKSLTTGFGNPFFAPINAYYDATVGMLTAARSYGAIRFLINRFLPERAAKAFNAVIPDITPLVLWPVYSAKALIEIVATRGARFAAKQLDNELGSTALRAAMGSDAYEAMVARALKVSMMTHELSVNHAFRQGFSRSGATVDSIAKVRGHYEMATDRMPAVLRNTVQLWKDIVNAVYLGPKMQYYTENYALLKHKFRNEPGGIPRKELEQLDYDVHRLGGAMDKVAANNFIRQTEAATPYATQTKLGVYNLYRNLANKDTRMVVWPRAFQFMTMYGASQYMMTAWNDGSRDENWNRQSEYERYRFLYIPTIKLLTAWFNGENPSYSRDLVFRIPLAPDLVPLTAGAAAVMEMTGMLPANATPKPVAPNYPNIVLESMLPAMPPVLQAMLAMSGMRLDPQTADRRGGNWIRDFKNAFKGGPEAEAATSLGEVSNTTSLLMNALFGVFGSHLAMATDVMLHAGKYSGTTAGGKLLTAREQFDFAEGLKKAVSELAFRGEKKIPDVPLLWQNKDKYNVMTPAWQYVGEANFHIQSIKGMRNNAMGKVDELKRQMAAQVGGMPKQVLQDAALISMADEIFQWQNPNGDLGKLKDAYKKLGDYHTSISTAYNMSQEDRTRKGNLVIRQQQDMMRQQHLAILYKEQEIEAKYGQYLAPLLKGRGVTMSSIDAVLRENLNRPARQSATESTAQPVD